ncbi:MAG: hypothetical protein AAF253_15540 [Pseudomonadota bacterium]
MLNADQRDHVRELIEAHDISRRLSSGQKWDVAVLMASFLGGAIAVLGVAGYFVVENAAKVRAGQVAAGDVATRLLTGDALIKRLSEATTVIPEGTVIAFDSAAGCPMGWIDFASGRGRAIVGATPPGGESGGLTRREFQEQGGAETHTLTVDEIPYHEHGVGVYAGGAVDPRLGQGPYTYVLPSDTSSPEIEGSYYTTKKDELAGKSHNNMPPYIALYFCKKESE